MVDITGMFLNLSSLSAAEFYSTASAVLIFVAGIVIYCIFIYKLYKLLARRDIFKLDLYKSRRKTTRKVFYVLEYLILFPLFIFLWFVVMSLILSVVSEVHTIQNIFLVSIAIVTAIRVIAYYSEDLSCELAKLLPFVLLGVMIVDTSYFSLDRMIGTLETIPAVWKTLLYYLAFTLIVEFIMRAVTFGAGKIKNRKTEKQKIVMK